MKQNVHEKLAELKSLGAEVKTWHGVSALLGWDQETNMPVKAVNDRSAQNAAVSALIHEKMTAARIGEILDSLGANEEAPGGSNALCAELESLDRAYIRYVYTNYRKATCLPAELVRRSSETQTQAQAAWAQAREDNNYAHFAPWLEKVIALKREEAEHYGYSENPYDPLLDDYEPGMKSAQVTQIFSDLKAELVPLVQSIAERIQGEGQIDDSFLHRHYPAEAQKAFGYRVLRQIGYPLDRGRLSTSAHPFTSELGNDDVRITTRYMEDFFNSSFFSIVHEAGHALYELGMGPQIRGNILSSGTSLGIHESQSRMWENIIGRSKPFWQYFLPVLREYFPENLSDIDMSAFWRGINIVEPSLIRVEADEVTYNLHVMLRFELEQDIIAGRLGVHDLPEAWREGMRSMLGIVPERNADGVLQDVHWSFGLFGYFPTYTLGNLYASQFWQALERDIPFAYEDITRGDFSAILQWLARRIHQYGSSKTAQELSNDICGQPLSHRPFMDYLRAKYGELYKL